MSDAPAFFGKLLPPPNTINPDISSLEYWFTSMIAGLVGALAMEATMALISRADRSKGSMIVALGGLVTGRRENAFRTGVIIHATSAIVFALIYKAAMIQFGLAQPPESFFVGIGFGFIHGIMVSLALVWVIAEQHPLEEFNQAGFAVGLTHLAGHIAFGAAVGLVVGVTSSAG